MLAFVLQSFRPVADLRSKYAGAQLFFWLGEVLWYNDKWKRGRAVEGARLEIV